MIGELVFKAKHDRLDLLAQIVAGLHWAAPIVARSCRTGVEHIGFFGPRKDIRNGQTLLVYRLARVYGTDRAALRESVWGRKAVFLDLEVADNNERRRRNGKKAVWQSSASSHARRFMETRYDAADGTRIDSAVTSQELGGDLRGFQKKSGNSPAVANGGSAHCLRWRTVSGGVQRAHGVACGIHAKKV